MIHFSCSFLSRVLISSVLPNREIRFLITGIGFSTPNLVSPAANCTSFTRRLFQPVIIAQTIALTVVSSPVYVRNGGAGVFCLACLTTAWQSSVVTSLTVAPFCVCSMNAFQISLLAQRLYSLNSSIYINKSKSKSTNSRSNSSVSFILNALALRFTFGVHFA